MVDTSSRDKSIDPLELVKQTYIMTNYSATHLQVSINDRLPRPNVLKAFSEFQYGFIGLYGLVCNKSEFDNKLKKRIKSWKTKEVKGLQPDQLVVFCRKSLKLYSDFQDHLAFLKIIE